MFYNLRSSLARGLGVTETPTTTTGTTTTGGNGNGKQPMVMNPTSRNTAAVPITPKRPRRRAASEVPSSVGFSEPLVEVNEEDFDEPRTLAEALQTVPPGAALGPRVPQQPNTGVAVRDEMGCCLGVTKGGTRCNRRKNMACSDHSFYIDLAAWTEQLAADQVTDTTRRQQQAQEQELLDNLMAEQLRRTQLAAAVAAEEGRRQAGVPPRAPVLTGRAPTPHYKDGPTTAMTAANVQQHYRQQEQQQQQQHHHLEQAGPAEPWHSAVFSPPLRRNNNSYRPGLERRAPSIASSVTVATTISKGSVVAGHVPRITGAAAMLCRRNDPTDGACLGITLKNLRCKRQGCSQNHPQGYIDYDAWCAMVQEQEL